MSSLVPGYKLVESFGADDEYETTADANEVEEIVSYVTVDMSGIDPTLIASSSTYRLIVGLVLFCEIHTPTFYRAQTLPLRFCSFQERS